MEVSAAHWHHSSIIKDYDQLSLLDPGLSIVKVFCGWGLLLGPVFILYIYIKTGPDNIYIYKISHFVLVSYSDPLYIMLETEQLETFVS